MKSHFRILIALILASAVVVAPLCHASGFVTILPKYKTDTVSAPEPEYPPAAEKRGHYGQGIFRLIVNDKTGIVDQVQIFKSAGWRELNAAAIMTLFNWKFKPGIKQRDVAVNFQGTGISHVLH